MKNKIVGIHVKYGLKLFSCESRCLCVKSVETFSFFYMYFHLIYWDRDSIFIICNGIFGINLFLLAFILFNQKRMFQEVKRSINTHTKWRLWMNSNGFAGAKTSASLFVLILNIVLSLIMICNFVFIILFCVILFQFYFLVFVLNYLQSSLRFFFKFKCKCRKWKPKKN